MRTGPLEGDLRVIEAGLKPDDRVVVVGRRGERTAFGDVTLSQTREHYDVSIELTEVDGIRCPTIARTLCDIARLHQRLPDAEKQEPGG